MPLDSDECRSHCPINFVLEAFGDRWTLLVVRDLLFHGKRTYGEFLASDEGISTSVLAERLRRLEEEGVVERRTDPTHGSRILYEPTPKGRDLVPIFLEMTRWSGRHDAHTNAPRALLRAIDADRDALVAAILAKLDAADDR